MPKQSFSRRQVIAGAASAGLVAATVSTAGAQARSAERVTGVQLYTVRDSMATDVPGTLQAIAGIGYREVEFAGYFGHSAADIGALLKRFGLRSPSSHMDARELRDDPQALIDTAAEIGHDYVTIAWLQPEDRESIDDYRRWAEVFNRAGEAAKASGVKLAYHNHDFEFVKLGGEEPFDVLLRETEPGLLDIELDFYWVRAAGKDVLDVIRRAPARMTMSHIKDMDDEGNMVAVGRGSIDFAAILDDPDAAGIRHCFVEHDNPEDPFQSVAYSHWTLRDILR